MERWRGEEGVDWRDGEGQRRSGTKEGRGGRTEGKGAPRDDGEPRLEF